MLMLILNTIFIAQKCLHTLAIKFKLRSFQRFIKNNAASGHYLPLDTESKLNVPKTFRKRPGRLF